MQVVQLTERPQFTVITGGLVPKGAYSAGATYAIGDSVDYLGSSYVKFAAGAVGTAPTVTATWQVLSAKGNTGSAGSNGTNGTDGTDGVDGITYTWRYGAGAPSSGLGIDGDLYLNTTNSDVYIKAGGSWSVIANIKGATGANGTNGTNGTNGVDASAPPGGILAYGGSSAPAGYLLCNGQAVSRSTYSALFAIIGTAYGVGDNSTTFNVPNIVDKFTKGKGAASALGDTGGSATHSHASHSYTPAGTVSQPTFTGSALGTHTHTFTGDALGTHTHTFTGSALAGHTHTFTGSAVNTGQASAGATQRGSTTSTLTLATHTHSVTAAGTLDSISGGTPAGTNSAVSAGTPSGSNSAVSAGTPAGTVSQPTFTGTSANLTHDTVNNEPPYIIVNYIIKT